MEEVGGRFSRRLRREFGSLMYLCNSTRKSGPNGDLEIGPRCDFISGRCKYTALIADAKAKSKLSRDY